MSIVEKIKKFVINNDLAYLNKGILPRGDSLFGIDNDLIVKNPDKTELYDGQKVDFKKYTKELIN